MNDLYMGMQTTWVSVERSTGSRSLRWQDTNHELLVQIRTWLRLEAAINDRRPGYERLGNLLSDRTIREEVNRTTHYIRGILAKGLENQILRHYFQDNLTWLEVFLPTKEDRGIPPPMYSVAIEKGKPPAY
ncbi:hypothetical protein H0H93_015977 [Arthromyces matolae]|nr:hypothetical protein H0H93_015977 [Arthromyces matolae]